MSVTTTTGSTTSAATTTAPTTTAVTAGPATSVRTALLAIAAASSVLAGLIHYAMVPEHRSEWIVYGCSSPCSGRSS